MQRRIDGFAEKYARAFPAAVKCLLTDREQLTSYLRFPAEHHKRIRHSNFIERTFGETRRRVKWGVYLSPDSGLNGECLPWEEGHYGKVSKVYP